MGDDVNIIVPSQEEEPEDTYERAGDELVALLTAQAERLGECLARIAELENRIIGLESREFAALGHNHEELAPIEHEHIGFALIEHEHENTQAEERKPDKPPEKQHPYFRKLGDL